jgi:uncharacterized membrane protein YdjX (TVP38/TMEM64 family)
MATPATVFHPDIEVRPAARRGLLVLAAALFAVGTFGSNIGPAWVDERPALVLALSARNRNLFGSVPYFEGNWLLYGSLGLGRLLLAGVALFFLGRWYGRKAIEWTEGQVGELPAIYRWFQTGIDRAGWLMVVLMPASNFVCLMAGHRRMRPARFVALLTFGIVLKLVVLWVGGQIFEDQIRSFLKAIEAYQWWVVGALFTVTFLQSARKVRRDIPEVLHEIETPDGVVPDEPVR